MLLVPGCRGGEPGRRWRFSELRGRASDTKTGLSGAWGVNDLDRGSGISSGAISDEVD